jgi:hypothetical protein
MMNLKSGDMVMLIWACCAKGRRHLGWVGTVESIAQYDGSSCFCGYKTYGTHAWIDIGGRGVVPVSWLIKIKPPTVATETTVPVEITEPA